MTLGSILVRLTMNTADFETDAGRAAKIAEKRAKEIDASFNRAAKAIGVALGTAVVAAGTALISLTKNAIDNADQLDEMSQKLGIGAEQLSKWGYAAKLSGTDLDGLSRGIGLLSKNAAAALDPNSAMGKLFRDGLQIDVKDAQGNLRSVQELLPEIADRFKSLDNQTLETALAMQIFGKSGTELLEFLNRGGEGIAELGDELQSLGGVISNETAAAAAEFKDELDRLKEAGGGLGIQIAAELLPTLKDLVEYMRDLVKEGSAASDIAGVISASFEFVRRGFDVVAGTIKGVTSDLIALGNAGMAAIKILQFDWEGAKEAIRNAAVARGMAAEASAQVERGLFGRQGPSNPWANVVGGSRTAGGDSSALERRLNAMRASGGGAAKKAKAGKTDEERAAENLLKTYEGLIESGKERIALMGAESELGKLLYRTTEGDLKKLDQTQKDALATLYSQVDAKRLLQEEIEKEDRLRQKEAERIADGMKQGKALLDDLKFELELMKMTNAERNTAIALRGLEAEAVSTYGEQIRDEFAKIDAEGQKIDFMDGVRSEFQGFVVDVVQGNKSIKESFTDLFDNIAAQITERIAQNWVDQLFGQMGTSGSGTSGGNWLGQLFGMFFQGGRAGGGGVSQGHLYKVNERGTETLRIPGREDFLMMGQGSGQVVPAGAGGGGGVNQTINFAIQGRIDRSTQGQIAQKVGREAQRASRRNG